MGNVAFFNVIAPPIVQLTISFYMPVLNIHIQFSIISLFHHIYDTEAFV